MKWKDWKSYLVVIVCSTLVLVAVSFWGGEVLTGQVLGPFTTLSNGSGTAGAEPSLVPLEDSVVSFVDADIQQGWIPWIIRQVSILIGALSLVVFLYAGISLILYGDNEEQFGKSAQMLVYAVVGIALAALSYSIVANLLSLNF